MKIINYVKRNPLLFLSSLLFSLLSFLNTPHVVLASLASLSSFVIVAYLGMKGFNSCQECGKEMAALSFFSAFLVSLDKGVSSKQSYDNASKYLSSYIEIQPYDDLLVNMACPYPLGRYQEDFVFVLSKDKVGEAHLPNYASLEKNLETSLRIYQEEIKKAHYQLLYRSAILLLLFFFFGFIVSLTPSLQAALSQSKLYLAISFLCSLSLYPLIYLLFNLQIKEVKENAC